MVKIAVLGYSGSGKSTLAGKLGARYGADTLYMDQVFWLPGWEHRQREEMRGLVGEYLDTHGDWVIDGNYSRILFERRMEEADRIVILRFSAPACLSRVWKRYRQNRGRARVSMTEGCPEKLDTEFIWWILYKGRDKQFRDLLRQVEERYPEKTVVLRNQRQLDNYEKECCLCLK